MSLSVFGAERLLAQFAAIATASQAAAGVISQQGAEVVVQELRYRAPVDTGDLRDSIGVQDTEVSLGLASASAGASVKYDRYYQLGTSKMPARPYAGDAAAAAGDGILGAAVQVMRGIL